MIKLSAAALAYARQPGFSALVFSDGKTPTGQAAAYKQAAADDLSQISLVALTEYIFYGKLTGRSSERTAMAVVAQINDEAGRWLRSVVGGRPLAGSVMQAAGNFGAITRCATAAQKPRFSSIRLTATHTACSLSSNRSCCSMSLRAVSG